MGAPAAEIPKIHIPPKISVKAVRIKYGSNCDEGTGTVESISSHIPEHPQKEVTVTKTETLSIQPATVVKEVTIVEPPCTVEKEVVVTQDPEVVIEKRTVTQPPTTVIKRERETVTDHVVVTRTIVKEPEVPMSTISPSRLNKTNEERPDDDTTTVNTTIVVEDPMDIECEQQCECNGEDGDMDCENPCDKIRCVAG